MTRTLRFPTHPWILVLFLALPASALAVPVAVSPGGEAAVAEAGSACPTFSWSAEAEAAGYELVVYALEPDGEAAAEPALTRSLPAGVSSWSASGGDCLAPGQSYAWAVRAEGGERGEWSDARFFRVPSRPSIEEVDEALAVLRSYFGEDGVPAGETAAPVEIAERGETETSAAEGARSAASPEGSEASSLSAAPKALTAGASAMRGELPDTTGVTYGVMGVSNSSDGSGLAGDNTAGGADLVLGGAVPAQVTENLWQLDSAGAQTFSFENPSGEMSLLVDGLEVLTGSITGDEITDGTVLFADWSQNGCASGQIPKWDGAAWSCAADDSGSGTATDLDCVECIDAGEIVDGSGSNVDADLLDGIDSTGFASSGHDHFGEAWSGDFVTGLSVTSSTDDGIEGTTEGSFVAGVRGVATAQSGVGVRGENTATSGDPATGVRGTTSSSDGVAVSGEATAATGFTTGVEGRAASPNGTGIFGFVDDGSGQNVGVFGSTASSEGTAGYFTAGNGGLLLAASGSGFDFPGAPLDFTVADDGTVTAGGFVGDGSGLTGVSADDADTLDGVDSSGFFVLSESEVVTGIPAFNGGTSGGSAPFAVDSDSVVANLNADLLDGAEASAFAAAGHDHFGEGWSGSAASGLTVSNASTATASAAVSGLHTASSGVMDGVYGKSGADDGHGVHGEGAGSGFAVGVYGETASFNGAGGLFVHTDGGLLLAANDEEGFSDLEFKVDAQGNVYADGTYRCGQSVNDGGNELTEEELAPCLTDDFPADFAEMLPRGETGLEPGDVLAVDRSGRLVPTTAPYQASVVGVHSTRPSYVGNSRYLEDAGYAPLALTGLVPVKATAENGPVAPGDLLTSSSTAGHAMRADSDAPSGSVIGKALGPLEGSRGKVLMMVVLQ